MKYHNIKEGVFLKRPNRFIAYVEIDGKQPNGLLFDVTVNPVNDVLMEGLSPFGQGTRNYKNIFAAFENIAYIFLLSILTENIFTLFENIAYVFHFYID